MLHAFRSRLLALEATWPRVSGLTSSRKSPQPIDLYEVSLDTARVQDPKDDGPFIEYIRAVLAGRKLDLIVPVGAPLGFLRANANRARCFPRRRCWCLAPTCAAIPRRNTHAETTLASCSISIFQSIFPTSCVCGPIRPTSLSWSAILRSRRYWASELHRDFQSFTDRVNITWFDNLTLPERLERAAKMPAHSAIFWFLMSEDAAGVPYSEDRALETMREVATVPIFRDG